MNHDILTSEKTFEDIQKGIIASNFSNANEILPSKGAVKFQEDIKKGEVDIISTDDIKSDHGNKYYTASDIEKFEGVLEGLVKKGEDDHLSEEEFEFLSKGREDIDGLERKAVAVKKGEVDGYVEVYVSPKSEDDEGGEGDDD